MSRSLGYRSSRKRWHIENGPQGEGARSFSEGLPQTANPYYGCSQSIRAKHRVWDKGWRRARMQAQKSP